VEVRKMIGAPKSTFVPKDTADDSALYLPEEEKRERFRGLFAELLNGATHTAPNQGPPSLVGSDNEPKKKE
jgi:hypothetical protein